MTYEEFSKLPIGTVIINDDEYDYVVGENHVYPSNPKEPFSTIRFHKFIPEGYRIATEDETKNFFEKLKSNGYSWNAKTRIVEELPKEFERILDEAAEEYGDKEYSKAIHFWDEGMSKQKPEVMKEDFVESFKAGAEWMEGQGETLEVEVKEDAGGYPYIPSIELYDYDKDEPLSKPGDKVIVQIRKK